MSLRGECGHLAAHLFGVVAHMVGDQMFDSKFLMEWKKRELASSVSAAQQIADTGMDVLALWDSRNDIHFDVPTAYAPIESVTKVFRSIDFRINGNPLTEADVKCGTDIIWWALVLERWYSFLKLSHYRRVVPRWAKDHYVDGPGGVNDSARKIAEFWDELWIQLTEPAGFQEKKLIKWGSWPNIGVAWDAKR